MNAAGLSPFRLFRPFIYATVIVALLVAFIAAYLAPDAMRRLKRWMPRSLPMFWRTFCNPADFAQLRIRI